MGERERDWRLMNRHTHIHLYIIIITRKKGKDV